MPDKTFFRGCGRTSGSGLSVCHVFSGAYTGQGAPFFKPQAWIRMGVGEHNRARTQSLKFSQPIQAAIDHHPGAPIRHQHRAVHAMASCPRVDFPARAKKREFHRALLVNCQLSGKQGSDDFIGIEGNMTAGKPSLLIRRQRPYGSVAVVSAVISGPFDFALWTHCAEDSALYSPCRIDVKYRESPTLSIRLWSSRRENYGE